MSKVATDKVGILNNLRLFRMKEGLTQEQLADLLQVSQRTVSAWERGTRSPSPQAVAKIMRMVNPGMEPWELMMIDLVNNSVNQSMVSQTYSVLAISDYVLKKLGYADNLPNVMTETTLGDNFTREVEAGFFEGKVTACISMREYAPGRYNRIDTHPVFLPSMGIVELCTHSEVSEAEFMAFKKRTEGTCHKIFLADVDDANIDDWY